MAETVSDLADVVLSNFVSAMEGHCWLETDEAFVLVCRESIPAGEVEEGLRQRWDQIEDRIEPADYETCPICGHQQPRGRQKVEFTLSGARSVLIELQLLGHAHAGGDEDDRRAVYLIRDAEMQQLSQTPNQLSHTTHSKDPVVADTSLSPFDVSDAEELTTLGSQQVDSYLADLSRNLRTPLNAIIGYSEMVIEDDDQITDSSLHSLQRIHESGHQLLEQVATLEEHIVRERHKRRLAETLRSLSTMLAASLEFDEVIDQIYESIGQVIDFDRSQILLKRNDNLEVVLDRCRGDWTLPQSRTEETGDFPTLFHQLLKRAPQPQVMSQGDDGFEQLDAFVHPHCRSWLGVGLVAGAEPVAVISLESKADDFYGDFDIDLMAALSHQAGLALSNAQEYGAIRQRARIDPLTGTCTRGYFFTLFEEQLADAKKHREDLGVVMVDLDRFKQINDTYGHNVGDEVLRRVATEMKSSLRGDDRVGRYGGEEFAVLLPGADQDVARQVAERIRKRVEQCELWFDEQRLQVTVSAGVATLSSIPHADSELLIETADRALYRAKKEGRNRVVVSQVQQH